MHKNRETTSKVKVKWLALLFIFSRFQREKGHVACMGRCEMLGLAVENLNAGVSVPWDICL
jgi:hypothetical protein